MVERRWDISVDAVRAEQIATGAVGTAELANGAVTRVKTTKTFIQSGATAVSYPFAAPGVERVSVSITFPVAFPTGVVPHVVATHNVGDVHVCGITAISNTTFTISVSDTAGVDKTAAVSATVYWIAIAP